LEKLEMKKTLVALAAATAVSAFAQVTITGTMDAGFKSVKAQDATASLTSITSNNSGTSLIQLSGTEDLGGGLKAQFTGVALVSLVSPQLGNTSTPYQNGNMIFNDQQWVGLTSDAFGQIRFGAPNSLQHDANGKAQPFGTAMGSGWASSGISRMGAGTTTLGVNGYLGGASANGRIVRNEKSFRWDSPTVNGAALQYQTSPANDQSTTNSSNQNGFTEMGATYSNGPLNAYYANTKITSGANAASQAAVVTSTAGLTTTTATMTTFVPANSALGTNSSVKYTWLGANYTVGTVTAYASTTTGKGQGVTLDTKSTNFAIKYAVTPTIDLLANYVKVTDNIAANAGKDQKLTAFGVDYKLSKNTNAYVRYEDYNTNTTAGSNKGAKAQAVGLKMNF